MPFYTPFDIKRLSYLNLQNFVAITPPTACFSLTYFPKNGKFYCVDRNGPGSSAIWESADNGINWTSVYTDPAVDVISAIACNNDMLMAVSQFQQPTPVGFTYTSNNGTAWTKSADFGRNLQSIFYAPTLQLFVIGGNDWSAANTFFIATTADGVTLNYGGPYVALTGPNESCNVVAYYNGIYFAWPGTDVLWAGNTINTLAALSTSSGAGSGKLVYNPVSGIYLLGGQDPTLTPMQTSADGLTWTNSTMAGLPADVFFVPTLGLFGGSNSGGGTPLLWWSADGNVVLNTLYNQLTTPQNFIEYPNGVLGMGLTGAAGYRGLLF
jgi:hypothetical protein